MRILYFAWLREKVGCSEETLSLPRDIGTVGALIEWLQGLDARHASAFAEPKLVRCAVDQDFAVAETSIAGATEIAFFPPVTGG